MNLGSMILCGKEAVKLLSIRNIMEANLLKNEYILIYSGLVQAKSSYTKLTNYLGEAFIQNLVEIDSKEYVEDMVIKPEGTVSAYEIIENLPENNQLLQKYFYSQEYLRNEKKEDMLSGKLSSFWQIGLECCSVMQDTLCIEEVVNRTINCLCKVKITNPVIKISDMNFIKYLFKEKLEKDTLNLVYEGLNYTLDPSQFYDFGDKMSLSSSITKTVCTFLEEYSEKKNFFKDIKSYNNNDEFLKCLESLDLLAGKINSDCVYIVPYIQKSWTYYNSFVFEVDVPLYPYAIAGGGAVKLSLNSRFATNCGVGIGINRIFEHLYLNK